MVITYRYFHEGKLYIFIFAQLHVKQFAHFKLFENNRMQVG